MWARINLKRCMVVSCNKFWRFSTSIINVLSNFYLFKGVGLQVKILPAMLKISFKCFDLSLCFIITLYFWLWLIPYWICLHVEEEVKKCAKNFFALLFRTKGVNVLLMILPAAFFCEILDYTHQFGETCCWNKTLFYKYD